MWGILNGGETDEPRYTQQTNCLNDLLGYKPELKQSQPDVVTDTVLILYMVTNYGAYEQYRYLNKYMHLLSAPAVMIILIRGAVLFVSVANTLETGFSPPERVNYWGKTQLFSPLTSASTAPEPAVLFRHS